MNKSNMSGENEPNSHRGGLLIVFEGIDGTGKTTQILLLAESLTDKGYQVVTTREPTDGPHGRRIRELFTKRHHVSAEEELELFIADRRQHVREVIEPALAEGKIVLTDRYYFSTAAYQGALGQDPQRIIERNEAFAPLPDLVLMLVVPTQVGVHRIKTLRKETLNDFEKESSLEKVAAVFADLKRDFIKRLDGTQSVEEVHKRIMAYVGDLLKEKGL